jgi:hypothetical protein
MGQWYNNSGSGDAIPPLWTDSSLTVNLRQEFDDLVLGKGSYLGIGIFIMHRLMDRAGGRCPCWNENRGSSSNCRYCKGESFAWTEEWVRGYFTQTFGRSLTGGTVANQLLPEGIFDKDKALIYLPSTATPATGDSMFRIRLNAEGKPYYPIERVEKWRCVNVEDRRQENGELAFWLVLCERVEF